MTEFENMVSQYWKYYLALKRNEMLTHTTTQMNLEDIMLSKIMKSQKCKYYKIPVRLLE